MKVINLIFKQLQLHNFASYSDSTIDLNDMGLTLIVGRNNCKLDNAYSNGSGKSAIFNGLCFALTGETTQGISTGIENIFTNPDDCWVKLTFNVDGDEFIIKRIKTPKQNLKIFINGEDKSGKGIRESSLLLAEYIPDLTPELLSSIIILGQGMPYRFTNNKPSHRKELLESLTKSDFMIQSIKDSLEARLADLKLSLRVKEDELLTNNAQWDLYKTQYNKLDSEMKAYENSDLSITEQIEKVELEISESTKAYANLNKLSEELSIKDNELNTKKSEIILNSNKELTSKLTPIEDNIKEVNKVIAELSAEIKVLSREILKLDSITDICPTCGQKIPEINKPDTSEQKITLDKLKNKLLDQKELLRNYETEKTNLQTESELTCTMSLTDINKEESEVAKQLRDVKNSLVESLANQSKATDKLYKLINMRDNYSKLTDEIIEINKLIEITTNKSSQLNIDLNNINSHLEVVQQMITLAKREFRGILLANVINFIDKKIKAYSKEVFGTDKLAFTLNDNYIDITYCDKLYENLSGGEKQKIDIIIQLALRDILSKQLNIHSNLLVLDEIYDNADAISCQRITNLISTLTDIDSIFIISHHIQDLGLTYDNQLLVEKNNVGISSITFS